MIREAHISDADTIVDFQLRMAMETEDLQLDKTILEKGVKAVFNDESKGHYYIAEVNGKVVGSMLTTYEWSDWRNGTVIWLQSVFVLPEYRRMKIFRKLYDYVKIKFQNDDNVRGIRLYVDKTNNNAQKVYKAIGMTNEHYQLFEWMKVF